MNAKVLIVAASDPLGFAGIHADCRACYAHDVMPFSVISATTAQNNKAVFAVQCVSPQALRLQLEAVLTDYQVDALKIGLLGDHRFFSILSEIIEKYKISPVVLDPVMAASSGASLLKNNSQAYRHKYRRELIKFLPYADFLTPNYHEATQIVALKKQTPPPAPPLPEVLLKELQTLGVDNVVLKGGHIDRIDNDVVDYFIDKSKKIHTLKHAKIISPNTRGSGCSFASSLAANLALGRTPKEAFMLATKQVIKGFQRALHKDFGGQKGPIWQLP